MIDNIYSAIGKRVKAIRIKQGLTIVKLGKIAKLSKDSITQIEKGKANPTISTLYKLAKALKTKPYILVNGF